MDKSIKELRSKAKGLKPLARIGKNGLNEGMIKEIDKLIEKKKLVKIRLLKSSLLEKGKDDFINELLMKTRSKLVESVGSVVVIYRP